MTIAMDDLVDTLYRMAHSAQKNEAFRKADMRSALADVIHGALSGVGAGTTRDAVKPSASAPMPDASSIDPRQRPPLPTTGSGVKPNVAPEDRMNLAVADFFTRAARLLPALQQRLESEEPLHGPNWREACLPFVKALEELEVHRYDDTKWIYVELDGRNRGIFAGLGKDLVNVYRSVWPKG